MIPLTTVVAGYRLEAQPQRLDGDVLIEITIFRISTEEHAILVPRATPAEARTAAHIATVHLTGAELRHLIKWGKLIHGVRDSFLR